MTKDVCSAGPLDLLFRLREAEFETYDVGSTGVVAELKDTGLLDEAADEIERLRGLLANAEAAASDWKKRYEGMAILHANKVRMIENGELIYAVNLPPNKK